jgi:dTMP kinase
MYSTLHKKVTSTTHTTPQQMAALKRGAFILLEGLDRSGKSTQCARLAAALQAAGMEAVGFVFPDRSTGIGQMISAYLKQDAELDDRAVHLLFAANRWEKAADIRRLLAEGTTIVCDRYSFSGIAYTTAKPDGPSFEWCLAPEVGLPAPDAVLFLTLSLDEQEARGDYGAERYEKREMQQVRDRLGTPLL